MVSSTIARARWTPPTYEQIMADRQREENYYAERDNRPSVMQEWAYRWRETCPCCRHQFIIELDSSEGFSRWEQRGYYEIDCPECAAELRYPFGVEYTVSLGEREIVRAGIVPDPADGDETTEDTDDEA